MSTLSTILAAVLGIAFCGAGLTKLRGRESIEANFERWGYHHAVLTATGVVELLAGVLLLAGVAVTPLAITGAILVIVVMVGALLTHQRASDPVGEQLPAAVLLVLAFALAATLLP